MIVSLIKNTRIFNCVLPETVNGVYWISDIDTSEKSRKLLSVEAYEGKWIVRDTANATAKSLSNIEEISGMTVLTPSCFYQVSINGEKERALLFVEASTVDRDIYNKYVAIGAGSISIGRQNCNITYDSSYTSGSHAFLIFDGNNWIIQDNQSTNGTYVNTYRVSEQLLKPGDVIFILGMKIIIGNSFIAINNPDGKVSVNCNFLAPYVCQEVTANEEFVLPERKLFYRSPRFKKDITKVDIVIDPPPQSQIREELPVAMVVGPAITMGMGSASMAIFTVINTLSAGRSMMSALPTVLMSFFMLLGMILWPSLTRSFNNKKMLKDEAKRQNKYRTYLSSIRDEIIKECQKQAAILNENGISLSECENRIVNRDTKLWEREASHNDFLSFKAGMGNLPASINVICQNKKFTMDEDNLQDDMVALAKTPLLLNNVPVLISLLKDRILGVVGINKNSRDEFLKEVLIQLSALYSYDEYKLVFVCDDSEEKVWEFVKWFPHNWNNDKTTRYMLTNMNDLKEIFSELEKEYDERVENTNTSANKKSNNIPYYVIVSTSRKMLDKCELVNKILTSTYNYGYSVIISTDIISELPKETSLVIDIRDGLSRIYNKNDLSGEVVEFSRNPQLNYTPEVLAKTLLNVQMDLSKALYTLPNMIDFMTMFGVGRIEHLNPFERWQKNDPTLTLQTPVGVNTSGELFMLDLHEKFQGPHGLVAGMTGSGKSEFIITYILSLAVNYHPDEVAFILIDYKGGGLAGAFEDEEKGIKLPHLAGTITNLDGAAVKRSLISIQSELRRRQAVFNEARKVSNEGTMDIYKYQRLYRNGIVSEPIPHLFIISDEFAELKTQQPEFMEQLTSAARIGRSLGVHLILATQKPNGVVDDQIWSNSRFRVCLKVQDKADSNDMIKRPDAAEISNTGRFYLQVGFNEYFDMGQSSWCGAPYTPSDTVQSSIDDTIQIIDNVGHIVSSRNAKKIIKQKAETKQIVAIVKYLSDIAKQENINVRPLWMKEIPKFIKLSDIREKYNITYDNLYKLNPLIGELDDPFNQSQREVRVPISEDGNIAVYAVTGGGKTTFVNTMLYDLLLHHSAEELNVYIMDFGSETLKAFEKAPQVGDVVISSDTEKVLNLFKMIKKEINTRKKLFLDYGGDFESYCKKATEKLPNILVIIHNYAGFTENFEMMDDQVAFALREGPKYGIHFVLTASSANSIRFKVIQNVKRIYALQLNEKNDYVSIMGPTEGTYPSHYKARGLVKDDHMYEFQVAMIDNEDVIQDTISSTCSKIAAEYTGVTAKPIPVLPKKVDREFLKNVPAKLSALPMAVDKVSLDYVLHDYEVRCVSMVFAQSHENSVETIQGLAEQISTIKDVRTIVIDSRAEFTSDDCKEYEYITDNFQEAIVEMFNILVQRNNSYKKTKDNSTFEHIVYVVNSMATLFDKLDQDGKDKLKILLEKNEKEYKVHFIIAELTQLLINYSASEWYKKQMAISDGIWIGEGVAEQHYLKLNRIPSELYKGIGEQFGIVVVKGNYEVVMPITTIKKDIKEEN